ncbi:MAG TPA: DNA-formamidopyrimidine glycosylase family protein [Actinopolymorphaceae bacterium]|jgi:NADH dehydrogenase/endonuclease-8
MPEGDTVYLAARRLDVALVGQVLTRAELRVPAHATAALAGMAVTENVTWGKHLFTRLDSGFTLHTHLRMDGTWTVLRGGRVAGRMTAPGRDTVRVLLATGGTTVVGERIPVVELIRSSTEGRVTAPLGPDPLRPDWDLAEAVRRVAADPDRDLAAVLLDQRCIAGLGNFWVNELCFLRGYDPRTPIAYVDVPATVRLAARALRASALQPQMYQVTTGDTRAGRTQWIYGRADEPCRRCGTRVKVRAARPDDAEHRRTWWCPHCQPLPADGEGT